MFGKVNTPRLVVLASFLFCSFVHSVDILRLLVLASFLIRSVNILRFVGLVSFPGSFVKYSEAFGFGNLPRSLGKYFEARGFGEFRRSLSNYSKLVRLNNATYKNWGTSQMYPSTSRMYSIRRFCS